MKLYVYVAFNGYLECSGNPRFETHDPESFATSFKRFLLSGDPEKVAQFENVSWYQVGEYDDEKMTLKGLDQPLFLLRCDEILDKRRVKEKICSEAEKIAKENNTDEE